MPCKFLAASRKSIEGMNNYIIAHTAEKRYIVYKSLTEILEELGEEFIRIHKSYVINKSKIKFFTKEQVQIGEQSLPIGKKYKTEIERF